MAELTEAIKVPDGQNVVGDTANVKFTSLPGAPALKAKVDTGADLCSLHADKWSVDGQKVHFTCQKLSPNVLSLPLRDHQTVKSATGSQYRPVIELNIRIGDKTIPNVLFNLADRSGMDFPVLLGRNALEKGRFLIDPSLAEQLQIQDVSEVPGQVPAAEEPVVKDHADADQLPDNAKEETLKQIYELMKDSDVTFADLIKFIRTEVTKTFEDVEY